MKKFFSLAVCLALVICIALPPISASAKGEVNTTISAGYFTVSAIKADGSLWIWGDGINGQIKIADKVTSASNYMVSYFGAVTINFVKADGSFWNSSRQNKWSAFETVKIMDGVKSVCGGDYGFTMIIKTDNSLWAYGSNSAGQLGVGTDVTSYETPIKVMDNVRYVSTGAYHTMIIKTDNTLWGCGSNHGGQLGVTKPQTAKTPIKIMDNVAAVSASNYYTMVVKTDSTLWGFGADYSVETADLAKLMDTGDEFKILPPTKIMSEVRAVTLGGYHTMIIKTDNSLWTYGDNYSGQLGVGTAGHYETPVKVMDNVNSVSLDDAYTVALKTDGSLWGWGNNYYKQLGGDAEEYFTPHKIMDGVMLLNTGTTSNTKTATPTSSKVVVNGKEVTFDAYNISDNNYFKLRDLAYILSGTEKQFDIAWDGARNAISLTSGKAYTVVGGEMTGKGAGNKSATPTNSTIYLDGKMVDFAAYNIQDNNYFKLRDIGQAFNFGVTWDGAKNTIIIDTSIGYTPG